MRQAPFGSLGVTLQHRTQLDQELAIGLCVAALCFSHPAGKPQLFVRALRWLL